MAVFTSQMRFTGLSGIDTQSMVTAIMRAEGMRLDRLRQQNQLTMWRRDAYFDISDTLRTFQADFLALGAPNSARLSSTFQRRSNTVQNMLGVASAAVRVTNSANAETGEFTLDVLQLAARDTFTSASGTASGSIVSTVNWNDPNVFMNLRPGDGFHVSLDGLARDISFSDSELAALSSAGNGAEAFRSMLQEKLDNAFGRSIIGGTNVPKAYVHMGANGSLNITANPGHQLILHGGVHRDTAQTAGDEIDFDTDFPYFPEDGQEFSLSIGQDGENSIISFYLNPEMTTAAEVAAVINTAVSELDPPLTNGFRASANADGRIVFGVGSTNSTVTVINAGSSDTLQLLRFSGPVLIEPTNALNDFGFSAGTSTSMDTNQTLEQAFGIAGSVSFEINGRQFTFADDVTVRQMINEVSNANIGVRMLVDTLNENFRLESTNTGTANTMQIIDTDGFLGTTLGLYQTDEQRARDAHFVFNGIETTRNSNNIHIAGINMDLTQVTSIATTNGLGETVREPVNGGPVTISVSNDIDGTLETIRAFIDAYNEMLKELYASWQTSRPRRDSFSTFEPLMEWQKEEMRDRDIENWEEQARIGLLHNNDILQGISTTLRAQLFQPVELDNGTTLFLHEIGISTTSNFRDGGRLEINEERLRGFLETRGEDVAELFTKSASIPFRAGFTDRERMAQQGISERINDILNNAVGTSGSITLRAGIRGDALFETTSQMYRTMREQNDRIAEMRRQLERRENNLFAMFSRMEQAVTASNNQMAYIQAQLGF